MAFKLHRRFPLARNVRDAAPVPPTKKEKTADDLVETIDKWLRRASGMTFTLSDDGRAKLAGLSTEILDNAERHSEEEKSGGWNAAGFMELQKKEGDEGNFVCHLAFVK